MTTVQDFVRAISVASSSDNVAISFTGGSFNVNVADFRNYFGIATARTEFVAVPLLNVRSDHSLTAPVVTELKFGEAVQLLPVLTVTQDGHNWQEIAQGWIAGDLTTTVDPSPKPVAGHKFGANVLSASNDLLNSAERLFNNKTPIASLTILNNVPFVNQISKFVPLVVARFWINQNGHDYNPSYSDGNSAFNEGYNLVTENMYQIGNLVKTSSEQFSAITDLYPTPQHKVVVQLTNEVGYNEFDYLFYYGIGKALEKNGYRGCLFNDAVGHPEPSEMLKRSLTVVENQTLFEWMNDNGHIYGIHCYGAPNSEPGAGNPYYGTRYKELFDQLPLKPRVLVTETGQWTPKFVNADSFISDVDQYDKLVQQTPYVLATNWWCYGTGNDPRWAEGNFSSALPQLENYLSK